MNTIMLSQIVKESILLEHNIAELYRGFNRLFPQDAYLWWQLSEEEEHHAELIELVAKDGIIPGEEFAKLFESSLEVIENMNNELPRTEVRGIKSCLNQAIKK